MIFNRLIEIKLNEWKNRKTRKPLIIRGARQVGKTTLVDKFAINFDHSVKLNLERPEDAKFFKPDKSSNDTIEQIIFEKNLDQDLSKTLLFIDEIQAMPFVIKQLRYLQEDYPKLSIIVAGSLLEFALKDVASYPVGRVEEICLNPLNFEEFLMAVGEDNAQKQLNTIPLKDFAFDKLNALFKTYTIIGGMPEVVKTYVENKSMVGLNDIYSSIWDTYKSDILKYSNSQSQSKVLNHIVHAAPTMRDRIVFNKFGNSEYKSREVGEALRMLDLARVIYLMYPTTEVVPPFVANYDRRPRLQFIDTGLLNYASKIIPDLLSLDDVSHFYKGFIAAHISTQELMSIQYNHFYRPMFWVRENANSNAEVDLTYQWKNKLIPIEIKSGKKGSLRSLNEFMEVAKHDKAIRLLNNKFSIEKTNTRLGKEYHLINLPLFLSSKVEEYLDYFQKIQ
jgi:uncharacterized protein